MWDNQEESDWISVDKWKEYVLPDQVVRKVTNWKKALEDSCKYENVNDNNVNLDIEQLELWRWKYISRPVGWTDSATSGNKSDFIRKWFSIHQVSLISSWLENGKKSDFNLSSDIPFVDVRNLNRNQNLAYKIVESYFRNDESSPILMIITGEWSSSKSFVITTLKTSAYLLLSFFILWHY